MVMIFIFDCVTLQTSHWTKHCGDFGMLKSLFLSLHNRGAVGKIVGELSEIKLVTSLLAREIQVHSEL